MKLVVRLVSIFIIIYAVGFLILVSSWNMLNLYSLLIIIIGIEFFCFIVYFTYVSFLKLTIKLQEVSVLLNGLLYFIFLISVFYLINNNSYINLLQKSNISLYYKSVFTSNTLVYISFVLAFISSLIMYIIGRLATKLEMKITNKL